ncbi:MAG: hypothetical protein ACK4SY_00530 [Pyrobaculum sp.]
MLRKRLEETLAGGIEGDKTPAGESWQDCLVKALVEMPPQLAQEILRAVPKEVLIKALESKNDPYTRLALLLLNWR